MFLLQLLYKFIKPYDFAIASNNFVLVKSYVFSAVYYLVSTCIVCVSHSNRSVWSFISVSDLSIYFRFDFGDMSLSILLVLRYCDACLIVTSNQYLVYNQLSVKIRKQPFTD